MALMSYRQYAEHRGCSLRAVQKAIGELDEKGKRTGRIADALVSIQGSVHPKIDSEKADVLWALNTDEAKRSTLFTPIVDGAGDVEGADGGGSADPEDDVATGDPEADAAKKSYHQSRALRESISVQNAQLDLDIRKGQLIDLETAKQLGFTTLRILRDALRNIGARVGAQVAAMEDPFQCEQLINAEIEAVLSSVTAESLLSEPVDDDEEEGQGD